MASENIFFMQVSDVCHPEVATTTADRPLVEVGALMRDRNISSVVIVDGAMPVGIVTDRDFRHKVVAAGLDPKSLTVGDVMNAPLVTIGADEYLFEALFLMSRRRIHRVCVVDADGRLAGILTDSDVLRLQTQSPQQLMKEIEDAGSEDELAALHQKVESLITHLLGTGTEIHDLVRTVAHLNDRILVRLTELVRAARHPGLTDRFALVVLGSEGRQEQTLVTDQDNAIIHADDLSAEERAGLEAFSIDLIDRLIAIGVPPCNGGIMAKNAQWRRSLSDWRAELDRWLSSPTPQNILSGSMFFDLRTLYGDASFERTLKSHIVANLKQNNLFLGRSAANVIGFKPPLGWFGRVVGEKQGEHKGAIELKKAGIFAITEGVKAMALQAGCVDGGTRDRIRALADAGVLKPAQADNLTAAFDFLVQLRLRAQLLAREQGRKPTNHLPLDQINRIENGRLKLALEEVQLFQGFLRSRFQLNS